MEVALALDLAAMKQAALLGRLLVRRCDGSHGHLQAFVLGVLACGSEPIALNRIDQRMIVGPADLIFQRVQRELRLLLVVAGLHALLNAQEDFAVLAARRQLCRQNFLTQLRLGEADFYVGLGWRKLRGLVYRAVFGQQLI